MQASCAEGMFLFALQPNRHLGSDDCPQKLKSITICLCSKITTLKNIQSYQPSLVAAPCMSFLGSHAFLLSINVVHQVDDGCTFVAMRFFWEKATEEFEKQKFDRWEFWLSKQPSLFFIGSVFDYKCLYFSFLDFSYEIFTLRIFIHGTHAFLQFSFLQFSFMEFSFHGIFGSWEKVFMELSIMKYSNMEFSLMNFPFMQFSCHFLSCNFQYWNFLVVLVDMCIYRDIESSTVNIQNVLGKLMGASI